jgi:hypothetical protein
MPNWASILGELTKLGSRHDVVRRKYLKKLRQVTGRNVIAYYSGWLQKSHAELPFSVDDGDKNGFMNAVYGLDPKLGLDLLLHTPGGDAAATESIVQYLHSVFGRDIRAIVPQLAMSAGTMIACACKEIVMGKQSSLGPIDPQIGGLPAHGVVEEFEKMRQDWQTNPQVAQAWQPIAARYFPTLIGECDKAIKWANEMVTDWLVDGMFSDRKKPQSAAATVIKALGDHALTKSHARHFGAARCKTMGLKILDLESSDELQDAVLSVHHAMMHTFAQTPAVKIIENHKGAAYINMPMMVRQQVAQ